MEQLILFRQSINMLNDKEFEKFTNCLARKHIVDMVFNHFLNELKNVTTVDMMNNMFMPRIKEINENIATIIRSRTELKNNNDDDEEDIIIDIDINNDDKDEGIALQIEDLPNVMISNISSFLTINDLNKFEQCSRSIFIGSRSPISVQKMKKDEFKKCMEFSQQNECIYHWNKLKCLKSIDFDALDCIYPKWGNLSSLFQNVATLNLNCYGIDQKWYINNLNNQYLKSDIFLFELNKCSLLNIKKFVLFINGQNRAYFGGDFLDGLISAVNKNKNMEYFELEWSESAKESVIFSQYEWISQLKGIAICCWMEEDKESILLSHIYPAIGDNLLSFHKGSGHFTSDIDGKFDQLKELCIPWMTPKSDIDILLKQNLNELRRVNFNATTPSAMIMDYDQKISMRLLLKKIIKSVDCINVAFNRYSTKYLDVINILIEMMRNIKKDHLYVSIFKVRLISDQDNIDEIAEAILRLINILNANCIHFKFKFEYNQNGNNDAMDTLLERIKDSFCVKCSKKDEKRGYWGYPLIFEISNDEFIVDSSNQWIMRCGSCSYITI